MSLEKLGNYPVNGAEARTKGDLVKVAREDRLNLIFGQDHPVLMELCVTNDYMHVGEIVIPVGGVGDAIFYVLKGPATFYVADGDETFHVRGGEAFFLPEGVSYQCLNYGSDPIRMVFTIAPGL